MTPELAFWKPALQAAIAASWAVEPAPFERARRRRGRCVGALVVGTVTESSFEAPHADMAERDAQGKRPQNDGTAKVVTGHS